MTDEQHITDVTLVAGYLGAGKTTWLNAHLRHGVVPGTLVMVNDFGSVNIDAELIEYRGDRLLKLDNGCLCCSLGDALGAQLSRIARWPVPPTALIIETSGVAHPARVADLIRVARGYRLQAVVTLVDLAALERHLDDARIADLLVMQIASADRLSLNRGGDLDASAYRQRLHRLEHYNPRASIAIEESEHIPGDRNAPSFSRHRTDTADTRPPTPRFASASSPIPPAWRRVTVTLPVDLARATLENTLSRHAEGLARAKGLMIADGQAYAFHWSAGNASWTRMSPRSSKPVLVCIGFAGPAFAALETALQSLVAGR